MRLNVKSFGTGLSLHFNPIARLLRVNKMVEIINLALQESGAKIAAATCEHPDYPESNILDPSIKTFWPTTGMFPQEFILTFASEQFIKKVILSLRNGIGR